ncbi:MAG: hypothetical protein ISR00_07200, partial [Flavobacteriales bacterium]|nr:hypothetical protein [Flavobacteriales bacterium]
MKQITTLIALALSLGVFAQDVAFKKGNFKDDKDGLEKAKINIAEGDVFLEKGEQKVLAMVNAFEEFGEALTFYLQAQDFNPSNSDLNRKIGHAYLYTNTPYLAMPFLKKSLELGGDDSEPFVHFLLGKAYQLERDFEAAERAFKKY